MRTCCHICIAFLAWVPHSRGTEPPKRESLMAPDEVPEGLDRSDWQGIRAAYEEGRHAFHPSEDGWEARNPRQQWTMSFDGRGFVAQPSGEDWQWGLELKSYGFPGAERAVKGGASVRTDGPRLSYDWDATLREWFVNDARGLEHGFTVNARPAGAADAPLQFDLAVRGTLTPHVTEDALGVEFRDADGNVVLNYAGLKVWDAGRKALTSRFVAVPEGVRLLVDERGARYPLTIDPVAQQAYLKPTFAESSQAFDQLGISVAISGDTVVVGACLEDSSSIGVNSDPNEFATDAGAAYVFVREGATWTQQAYLKPSSSGNTQQEDRFGQAVAIDGDTIVVGAYLEDSGSTGVNSERNENATNAGAAYVFTRSGTKWTQQAYLKPAAVGTSQEQDLFGYAVAVSGDTIVVGAFAEDGSGTGVNGVANEGAANAGAAYIFTRAGTVWSQQAYLKPAAVGTTQAGDQFGFSVALSGDTVVVGANGEDSGSTGVNFAPNENASDAGAAFVFTRTGTVWTQQAALKPAAVGTTQTGDEFGHSVAIAGGTVVVGARFEDSSGTGVNGPPDELAANAGAAYVYTRSGANWTQQAFLKPAAVGLSQAGDAFGFAVSIAGDTVAVGAPLENSGTTGAASVPDESADNAGAAYVFTRSGTVWSQQAYLKPADIGATQVSDVFGRAVAVAGDTLLVGAPLEDGSAPGVPADEAANDAGAAGVFVRVGATWTQQGYLKPFGSQQRSDQLGFSVAVSGETVVVGAPAEDSSTTGVNSPANESALSAGAAYVFVREGSGWTQQAYLKPASVGTTQESDLFGVSVAVSGDTIVVGANREDSSSTGVNSTPNENASDAGAAYVFVRDGSTWTQQAYLKPASAGTTQAGDEFGVSVAVSGDTLVVGAFQEDSSSTGVNSPPNESADDAGAAYVFTRSGTTWTQQAYLKPAAVGATQAGDDFGNAVAIAGETVVVGAPSEDSSSTGVNGMPNESAFNAGAAYVFTRSGSTWTQQAYLKPAAVGTTQAGDQFGLSVAISSDTLVVGAPREDSGTTGLNGFPDELGFDAGAASVFTRSGTTWTPQAYLKPAHVGTTQESDYFGGSVAVSGDTVVVGAQLEDSSSTGVNSTPNDTGNSDAGAAYVFTRGGTLWTQQAYLKPAAVGTTQSSDFFGRSVAVSGEIVVVGAQFEGSRSTGVNSVPDELAPFAGAAYIFTVFGIIVEQPAGTFLFSGVSGIDSGAEAHGDSAPTKTFTVRNLGPGTLAITGVSTVGGEADDFAVNTTGMLASLPVGGSTTFAVTFTPATDGSRATTLRIVNSDALEPEFDVTLTGLGLSFTTDRDGDGLNDASERQLSALGFDFQVGQSGLVDTLFSHASGLQPNLNEAGFFTPSQVQTLHMDAPLIQRDPLTGIVTLTFGLEQSPTLGVGSFVPFPFTAGGTSVNAEGEVEFQFTSPDAAAFYILEAR